MKKIVVFVLVMLFFSGLNVFIAQGSKNNRLQENESSTNLKLDAHTVFSEYYTNTTSEGSPVVSDHLSDLYTSGNYDFQYVSMLTDKNEKASERSKDLGVNNLPDVQFDGGYTHVEGSPADDTLYINAIEDCHARRVQNLDMEISALITNGDNIFVNVTIINHECCGGAFYKGHLTVYVTEIQSRWNDINGNKFKYGFLDYAINKDVTVVRGYPAYETAIWDGEKLGYNINPSNIKIIAVVSSRYSGYADETAAATPSYGSVDTIITEEPQDVVYKDHVTYKWTGVDRENPSANFQYSYLLLPQNSDWSPWTSSTQTTFSNLPEGYYTFKVKAKNDKGEVDPVPSVSSFTVNLAAPEVTVTKPSDGIYFNNNKLFPFPTSIIFGTVDIEAEASDDNAVEKVVFYVNDEKVGQDYYPPYIYRNWAASYMFRSYAIKAVVCDEVGNKNSDQVRAWKII